MPLDKTKISKIIFIAFICCDTDTHEKSFLENKKIKKKLFVDYENWFIITTFEIAHTFELWSNSICILDAMCYNTKLLGQYGQVGAAYSDVSRSDT